MASSSGRGKFLGRALYRFIIPPVCPSCLTACRSEGPTVCPTCLEALREMGEPRCPGCGGEMDGVLAKCSDCLSEGERPWTEAVSVFRFRDTPRKLVHRLKYGSCGYLAPFLGTRMAENWCRHGAADVDVVTPVPLHWRRLWSRGYNQAELLVEAVACRLGLPKQRLLRRTRATGHQARLDMDRRHTNIRGAFGIRPKAGIEGRTILLVDDVITTGSTLSEAANTLLRGGARSVAVLTCARG